MEIESLKENVHSVLLLLMALSTIIVFFMAQHVFIYIPFLLFMFLMFKMNGLGWNKIVHILCVSLLFSLSYFVLFIFFPNPKLNSAPYYSFGSFQISKYIWDVEWRIFMRITAVAVVSFSSVIVINPEKILIYLMSRKVMPIEWGYPLLLALNSIGLLKDELDKIRINARLRRLAFLERFMILFPLLVFAIRHADRGAMSLVTRGITKDKLFYFDLGFRIFDYIVMSFFAILCLGVYFI